MSNSPLTAQGIPRLDLNTHSASDSRDEDSTQNDISSPSIHRFSSDDNSGWKSETTETSEGNFSLSQYPLDDPSCGEESPQENSSLHEEALTSAITEVSKDFISGNFSPGKYPHVESDSSDGDHHLDGHMGAVYARYPESGTGMSDCDWNPYGTDNDNETPRSSASDAEARRVQPINSTSKLRQKEIDIRIPTGSMDNGDYERVTTNPSGTRDFVRIPTNNLGKSDLVKEPNLKNSSKELDKRVADINSNSAKPVPSIERNSALDKPDHMYSKQPSLSKSDIGQTNYTLQSSYQVPTSGSLTNIYTKPDPYTMYSPEEVTSEIASDQTATTSTLQGSGDKTSVRTGNQYIPSSYRQTYTSPSYSQLLKDNEENNTASTKQGYKNINGSDHSSTSVAPQSLHTQTTTETVLSSSSIDTTRRESGNRYGSGSSSQTSQGSYVPIGERAKLLGLPEDFLNPQKTTSSTDFAVPRVADLPLLSRVQIPEKDTISPPSSYSKSESMSKRVSKLLEEASQLGTTLHHHLYSREALGLDGEREPSVLRSYSPMRKSDHFVDRTEERSITPGSGLLPRSGEQSIRSSLGDEVAKLMMNTENEKSQKLPNIPSNVPSKVGSIPSNLDQMNTISSQTYLSLASAATGRGPGSTDSQESGDSLSQRVRKILSDTAHVRNGSAVSSETTLQNNFDYSRLQRDLQEIQNSLDPGVDLVRNSLPSPDMSKTSDKSIESLKSHKLLWDHGADLGYDDSLSGRFLGTMKTDTETECESTYSGKGYNGLSDTLELVSKSQKDSADIVSDQVESDMDDRSIMRLAPDVEEIIRRYQTEKPEPETLLEAGDSSGLASRVMKILSQEPPRKQAYGILESARREEKEMIEKMADKPNLDTSTDSQTSTNSSFVIHDKDVRKQLEWSGMSAVDKSVNSSYLSGLKTQPFSALGNAKTFLSTQLAKNADRTFNHSIDLKTPYRHVIDCYPLYGVERTRGAAEVDQFGRPEPEGVKEAWPDGASGQDIPTEQLLGATSDGTANVRPGSREHQRTYSDPRELSPEPKIERDGHTRSKSEEPRYGNDLPRDRFYNLESVVSTTNRRIASSPLGDRREQEKPADIRKTNVNPTTPPSDSSPGSGSQLSPDSDNSTRRREAARLRPYRPHGSRELYYTEDGEDSMAESITTVESNHTVGGNSTMESTHSANRRVTWNPSTYNLGSDDAIGPNFPSQYLGSRKDGPPATGGIYGTRNLEKKDTLSTIDEKSLADDKEKSGTDSGVDNPRSDLTSSHGSNLSSYRRDQVRDSQEDFTRKSDEKLALSIRSDPGDQYATPKRSTRYQDNSDPRSDSRMYRDQREPGPVKSRSETDLATLPDVNQKYSSPMYGDRFMELSNQPSPIYSHHTSMASPAVQVNGTNRGRSVDDKLLEERFNVKPLEKGPDYCPKQEDRHPGISRRENADGMNRDDQPGSTPYNKAYDRQVDDSLPLRNLDKQNVETARSLELRNSKEEQSNRSHTHSLEFKNPRQEVNREPVLPLEKGKEFYQRGHPVEFSSREAVRPLDKGPDFQSSDQHDRPSLEQGPLSLDMSTNPPTHLDIINPGYRPTDRISDYVRDERPLNRGPVQNDPLRERRTLEKGPNYYDMYRPRRDPPPRSHQQMIIDDDTEELEFRELPRCPDPDFEDLVKEEKAKIQIEYELQRRLKQKGYMLNSTDEKEFGAEYDRVPPNERAKSLQRKLEQESHKELAPNINDLWQKFQEMNQNESTSSLNSSRIGAITDLLKNPTKHIVQKIAEERTYEKAKERRIMEELAEKARGEQKVDTKSEKKRQELQNLRRLSEEESNGSYAEILQEEQRKRQQGKHKTTKQDTNTDEKQKKEMENKMKGSKKAKLELPAHGDSIDTLYSIPEDASFEVTPSKTDDSNSVSKSKKSRQQHVIDPLMSKLKDKIESQKQKIDKERRREMKRIEKLKKLEMLLTAKKKGKLSDQAIDVELQYVSSTSAAASSESSNLFGSDTTISANSVDHKNSIDSLTATGETTSTKDSSIEIQKVRTKKVKHGGMLDAYMASIGQGGKGDDSEASTDDLQVVRKIKSPKPSKSKSEKKKRKEQKNRPESSTKLDSEKDYYEEKIDSRREKDLHRRERSKSPKSRQLRDAATMYPSPIVKSPVSKRKVRDVYVRSEAVQTSPLRSWSPPREEQGVISVPLMSSSAKREVKPFDSRQQRQRSYSPIDQYSSSSPNQSILSRSISPPSRPRTGRKSTRSKSPPKPRVFLPESDEDKQQMKVSPPPKSKMFTPETPDDDLAGKVRDSPNGGLTWFVPMTESKPWRKPLKERQAFAVNQVPWQPNSVSSAAWKAIIADNPVNKSVGESTQFDLDTTGHFKELDEERSDEENFDPKPLSRLSLQEAFQTYKQDTISKLRARQKRLALSAKERELQEMLEKERNRLFSEEKRKKEANPEAHPLSENLHKPKRRAMSKGEMKELTQKLYKKLPEVQNQKLEEKRQEEYSLNRLRAKVFNRRIQRNTLKKQENRRKRSPSKNIP